MTVIFFIEGSTGNIFSHGQNECKKEMLFCRLQEQEGKNLMTFCKDQEIITLVTKHRHPIGPPLTGIETGCGVYQVAGKVRDHNVPIPGSVC